MTLHNLAIIIPAFRNAYLRHTLASLAEQTDKNFNVYIGNDAGDAEIDETVSFFNDKLNIRYTHFKNNLGSLSLVKQWERCLQMIDTEEWIWILPDDDFADKECVGLFNKHHADHDFDVFRFNVKFVDNNEQIFKHNPDLKPVQPAIDSLFDKLKFTRPSTIAEYIFRRSKFEQTGFTELPMAWGTDDLLWYTMGHEKGIHGTNDAFVYLRHSHLNISNNYTTLAAEKIRANFLFFQKLIRLGCFTKDVRNGEYRNAFPGIALKHIMYNLQDFSLKLSLGEMWSYAKAGNQIWGGGLLRNVRRFWLNNKRISQRH